MAEVPMGEMQITAGEANLCTNGRHTDAYRCQLLHVFIRSPERGQAYLLGELSEGLVTEQRHMAQQLVADVRLRRVHGPRRVTDVLGGVEHSEGQSSQEITRGEQPWMEWGVRKKPPFLSFV